MSPMTILSRCPVCDGAITEKDVEYDMHLDDTNSPCGNCFPTAWTPDVEYEPIESEQ